MKRPENGELLRHGRMLREDYIEFKKQQFGEEGYKKLKLRAFAYRKKDDKLALIYVNQLLDDLTRNDPSSPRQLAA